MRDKIILEIVQYLRECSYDQLIAIKMSIKNLKKGSSCNGRYESKDHRYHFKHRR